MSDTHIQLIKLQDEIKVSYEGDEEELIKMIVFVSEHDEDFRDIIMSAAYAIDYLEGMDDIQNEINNL